MNNLFLLGNETYFDRLKNRVLIFWFVLYQDKMNNRKLKTGCEPACLSLAEEQYDSLDRTIGFLLMRQEIEDS